MRGCPGCRVRRSACERQGIWSDESKPPPIEQEGTVYTPVSQGEQGCLLYSVHIPGGQAPAALVYRSEEGWFSYARPDRCVSGSK